MKRNLLWIAALLAAASVFFFTTQARAQQPSPPVSDDQVNAVARELYCPVCENIPLDVCPTTACAKWRDLIRVKLGDGWTKQQIKDYFALQYGDRVLAAPPARGLNWAVYVLPPLFILGGVVLVISILRRTRKAGAQPVQDLQTPGPAQPADDYTRRIEEELRRRG
jgi:cytochrome c-type biogenesis protein CcmH